MVLIGIGLCLAAYMRLYTAAKLDSTQRLTEAVEELFHLTDTVEAIATGQVLAVQGLFESSIEVTPDEFHHFVRLVEDTAGNSLGYAPMVPVGQLDAFLARTRTSQPDFTLHGPDSQAVVLESGSVYWPLLYITVVNGVGFDPGFDLGSDPAILLAIEAATGLGRPAASAFIQVPGDADGGDFVIVSAIRKASVPIGVAFVTVRLDELLATRARQLLGPTTQLTLTEWAGSDEALVQDPSIRWVESVTVAGHQIRLILDEYDSPAIGFTARWLLIFGVVTSFLLGWLVNGHLRRRAMSLELDALQQTLAEKDRFLSSVSHQLRSPLTVIVGALAILSNGNGGVEPEIREMLLHDASVSSQDLERLIEDYLTAGRLSAGALTLERVRVDLDSLVSRIVVGIDIPDGVTLTVGHLGKCEGDDMRIRQIVRNVVRNATRYALTKIQIQAERSSVSVIVTVLNDGEPVSDDVVDRLFEPFVRGASPGQPESIGLGLSVSRELARRMGGDLTYSYEDGIVRFNISLPLASVDQGELLVETRGQV